MVPVLFRLGDLTVYSHGFFLVLGLFIGGLWLVFEAKRRRWSKEETWVIVLSAFVGA